MTDKQNEQSSPQTSTIVMLQISDHTNACEENIYGRICGRDCFDLVILPHLLLKEHVWWLHHLLWVEKLLLQEMLHRLLLLHAQ
jgi:hypothetical protein